MTVKITHLFEPLPKDLTEEVFTDLVQTDTMRIVRIVSHGQTSPESGWYDQIDHEWVVVLKGAATLTFEQGDDITLRPGDSIQIPAHTKHRVSWTDPTMETIWLAVHYHT